MRTVGRPGAGAVGEGDAPPAGAGATRSAARRTGSGGSGGSSGRPAIKLKVKLASADVTARRELKSAALVPLPPL